MLIQLKNISVTFNTIKEVKALKDISVNVRQGEWLNIFGPSGSGKTTLLNVVGGMEKISEGVLLVNNKNIVGFSEKELQEYRRNTIGYIFQDFRLFEQFTVLENVMLPLIPYMKKEKIKEKAQKVIEALNMAHRLNSLPGELSGGEKQRVAIARALINEPQILLCDEPTGNLDLDNRDNILNILNECQKSGITILMVSHDLEISKWGNAHLYLRDGNLVESQML